jgi:putative MATE family efflux protein
MQNQGHNVLDTDQIGQLLIKLSVPMLFGTLVQVSYNIVDTIFIGHYVGTMALAALSVVFPLQMMAMGVSNMVAVGGASLISRLMGGGDKTGAERTLGNGTVIGILLAILLTAIVLPNVDFWIKLIGASDKVFPLAKDYLTIIMSGAVFSVLSSVLMIYIRAEGNARVSMTTMILGSGLNIILDAIFIIPLHMGVSGAALATVISQIVATIYALSYYITGSSYIRLRIRNFLPDFKILRLIFAIGVAQFAQAITTSVAAMFIIKGAATYGGDLALSSFGIIQRILNFAMMPGMVIAQGMQPILGFNYGAKRYSHVLKTFTLAAIAATILSILLFLVFYLLPGPIIRVFTNDKQLIDECVHVMRLAFLALPVLGFFNIGQQVFPSIGKAVESFIVALTRPLVFMLPSVIILPRFLDLDGVWLSFPTSDGLTFLLVVVLIIPLIRKFQKAAVTEKQGKTIPINAGRILDPAESRRIIK